ncbi:MAG: VOC family protein [Rhodospirillaceae bacterium]|nr:VOC family protein [Rhodospirillaceae bacterium]
MTQRIRPFLMFEGRAEEAMRFYVSLFADARILDIERWRPGEPGPEGTFKLAHFVVGGLTVTCFDSPAKHGFTFTPSVSLFVDCTSEEEIRKVAPALAEGGSELMPLDNYGFSRLFAWVNDRFGVSWQLNLV